MSKEICPWYDDESLLITLDAMAPPERLMNVAARMPIVDKFNDMGILIMGKLQVLPLCLPPHCRRCCCSSRRSRLRLCSCLPAGPVETAGAR